MTIKTVKKFIIIISYFFFWLIDYLISIQISEWISLPSYNTSAPSLKAIWLGTSVDFITTIILIALFYWIIRKLGNNSKTKKSYGFWINMVIISLMFLCVLFSNLGGPLLVSDFIEDLVTITVMFICFFAVGLGIFDFYKLLRTWNIWWYYYGIALQGLAITMILFSFSTMC